MLFKMFFKDSFLASIKKKPIHEKACMDFHIITRQSLKLFIAKFLLLPAESSADLRTYKLLPCGFLFFRLQ